MWSKHLPRINQQVPLCQERCLLDICQLKKALWGSCFSNVPGTNVFQKSGLCYWETINQEREFLWITVVWLLGGGCWHRKTGSDNKYAVKTHGHVNQTKDVFQLQNEKPKMPRWSLIYFFCATLRESKSWKKKKNPLDKYYVWLCLSNGVFHQRRNMD